MEEVKSRFIRLLWQTHKIPGTSTRKREKRETRHEDKDNIEMTLYDGKTI